MPAFNCSQSYRTRCFRWYLKLQALTPKNLLLLFSLFSSSFFISEYSLITGNGITLLISHTLFAAISILTNVTIFQFRKQMVELHKTLLPGPGDFYLETFVLVPFSFSFLRLSHTCYFTTVLHKAGSSIKATLSRREIFRKPWKVAGIVRGKKRCSKDQA